MKEKTNLKILFAVLFMLSALVTSTVILKSTASDSVLDDLRTIAATKLIDATRADIANSITATVVRADVPVLFYPESSMDGPVTNSSGSMRLLYGLLGLLIVAVAVTELLVLVAWLRGLVVRRREASGAAG